MHSDPFSGAWEVKKDQTHDATLIQIRVLQDRVWSGHGSFQVSELDHNVTMS